MDISSFINLNTTKVVYNYNCEAMHIYGLVTATAFFCATVIAWRAQRYEDLLPVILLVFAAGIMYDVFSLYSL